MARVTYCKFDKQTSDVYLLKDEDGAYVCWSCPLSMGYRVVFGHPKQGMAARFMVQHAQEHLDAGHRVPERARLMLAIEGAKAVDDD